VDVLARYRKSSMRRLVLMHLVLAVAFVIWRVLENTPATSAVLGSAWSVSLLGRGLVIVCMIASFAGVVAILAFTWIARRDWPVWILLAALVAALVQRELVDAFDIVYLLLVALATAVSFATRRL